MSSFLWSSLSAASSFFSNRAENEHATYSLTFPEAETQLYQILLEGGLTPQEIDQGGTRGAKKGNHQITSEELHRAAIKFSRLNQNYPEEIEKTFYSVADAHLCLGLKDLRETKSCAHLKAAQFFAPYRPEVLYAASLCEEEVQQAERYFGAEMQIAVESSQMYRTRGKVHFRQGKYIEAHEDYRQAQRLDPSDPETNSQLTSVLKLMCAMGLVEESFPFLQSSLPIK